MERVGVLINKLQEQMSQNADVQHMLVTAQLLHNELLIMANLVNGSQEKKVSVVVPHAAIIAPVVLQQEAIEDQFQAVEEPENQPVTEQIQEIETPVPEIMIIPTPAPEPTPIPHFIEQKPWLSVFAQHEEKTGSWALDPVLEVPTLAHQEKVVYELNDSMIAEGPATSLNDKLRQNKSELSSILLDTPIRDLKKAISINDRHRFIHELFRGDETMYERSIKTINTFHIFAEAEFWIQRELKVKLGWDTSLELVKTFDQLVKRRFS